MHHAFTIVELLIVVGMLILIGGVIVPMIGRANVKSSRIRCLMNLKHLSMAWACYNGDNRGRIVTCYPFNPKGHVNSNAWVLGLSLPRNDLEYSGEVDSYVLDATNQNCIRRGKLFPYCQRFEAYRCPSDRRSEGGIPFVRSYSMNCWMNGMRYGDPTGPTVYRLFKKAGEISNPSRAWVFIDEDEATINDALFRVDMGGGSGLVDMPSRRHRNGYGIGFVDGHSEIYDLVEDYSISWQHDWGTPGQIIPDGHTNTDWLRLRNISTFAK